MKQKLLSKVLLLLFALVAGSTSVWADSFSFSPNSKNSGDLTNAPIGVTATFLNTYNNKEQITSGNSMTLTITGLASNIKITGITLHTKTNASKGAGTATATMNGTEFGTYTYTVIGSSYTNKALTVTPTMASGNMVVIISCTTNSVYCDLFTFTYEVMPTSISLDNTSLDLTTDNEETLSATVLPTNATDKTVTWTSDDEGVATVSTSGTVTAVGTGSATITATTVNGLTATCTVNVASATDPIAVVSTPSLDFDEVEVGHSKSLTFTVTPNNLTSALTIATNNAKYSVSPTSIAQSVTTETTITVTASPTELEDGMDGSITISGGGLASDKIVTLTTSLYQVANVSLSATDSKGTFKQGEDVVTSISSRVGSSATVKAVPVDGFTFLNWSAVGATPASSTNAEEEFIFTSAAPTLTANFVRNGVNPAGYGMNTTDRYTLVTDASSLTDGDRLLFVGTDTDGFKTLSTTQGDNNRSAVDVTIAAEIINTKPNDAQEIILEGTSDSWYFNVGSNSYLYAASSTKNYLRSDTKSNVGNNGKATISITGGEATITFQGSNTRNLLQYNASSDLFSCYSSTQAAVRIFRFEEGFSSYDVTIGSTGWRTLVSAHNVSLPSGVKAYIVTASEGDEATLTEVASVKANTPVLLNGPDGSCTLTIIDTPAEPTGNLLEISTANVSDNGCYVLAERNEKVGFYLWEGGSLGAGRVILPASAVSGVREFIGIGGGSDGINMVQGEGLKVQDYYDLSGRRVVKPTKGLYIVNGKKVVK